MLRRLSLISCIACLAAWGGQEPPLYRSVVELTRIKVAVLDDAGAPVRGLGPEDFRIREDGRERPVQVVLSPDNSPLDVALVLDFSQSVADTWPAARESAHRFLDALPDRDCVHLLPFNERVGPGVWGAPDDPDLRVVDAFPLTGTTLLYDALVRAQEVLETRRLQLSDDPFAPQPVAGSPWPASGPCSTAAARDAGERRRAIVVLTDGTDRASAAQYSDVLTTSWHAEVPIFPVAVGVAGISDHRWRRHIQFRNLPPRFGGTRPAAFRRAREARVARGQLGEIARVTGGQMVLEPEIADGYADVLGLLRSYYVVGYRTEDGDGGGWSDVEVEVDIPGRDVVVRAAPGIHRVPVEIRAALEALRRGKALFRRGELPASLAEFDRAAGLAPDVGGPFFGRGLVLEAMGSLEDARNSYRRALEHDPGLPEAHARIANLALRLGRDDEAWEHAVRARLGGVAIDELLDALRRRGDPPFDLRERSSVPVVYFPDPAVPSLPTLLAVRPLLRPVAAWLDESPAHGVARSWMHADVSLVPMVDPFESVGGRRAEAELRFRAVGIDGESLLGEPVAVGGPTEDGGATRIVEAVEGLLARWAAEHGERLAATPPTAATPDTATDPTAVPPGERLVGFELADQFQAIHTDEELRGLVVLLQASGLGGHRHLPAWTRTISRALSTVSDREDLRVIRYLDSRDVLPLPPISYRQSFRDRLARSSDAPILIDWDGRLMKVYGLDPDEASLLLFDREGRLRARVAGDEPGRRELLAFVEMIRRVLEEGD